MTKRKMAAIWRVPQSGRELPDARPAPDFSQVLRKVEGAMRSLPLWIESAPIEERAEKYAELLYSKIGTAAPQTARQSRAHLIAIREAATALALTIGNAGPDIEAQLNECRRTSLDGIGIKTPSVSHVQIAAQWIAEAAALSVPASRKTTGPDRKVLAEEVSRLAAMDYYSLTGLKPTAAQRVKGGGFLEFLKKTFVAVGIPHASAERFATDAVKWFKAAKAS